MDDKALFYVIQDIFPEVREVFKEYQFIPPRRWRFDYAFFWRGERIAIEVEGGIWIMGRHNRGWGFVKDMEKYNTATAMGWRVFRVLPQDVKELRRVLMLFKESFQRYK